ncbi:PREDICTED: A-kinase anchor protein 14-like, partial [Wasmannia auropunctata]|uniref:A-kinase anchor protein 14-like n=1 Tax=Wasmannia auropunctata TaxID=64793 RepID=UPI0005F0A15A
MNVRNGLRSLKKEMLRWNQLSALRSWMFHVKFIGLNREGTAEFYMYQVLWSIPTPAYPEPYVTVSVYFCIVASRVQPPHFPVDVSLLCIFSALSPCFF